VAWRHLRRREAVNISTGELYVMGLVANAVPLLGLFFLPWPLPLTVLSQISLPVIVILPLATALLGWMMVQQGVRKQADHEMEERRRYLEGVLRAAPDAIVTLDANHHIVEWNPGADRLFGYSEEEVRGKNIDNLITGTNKLEEAAGLTKTVMSGKEVRPTETVRYRKDGSAVDVILAGSPILIGDKFAGAVAVYTDISERKRMEEQLAHIATHDALTDLPNRLLFGDRLKLTTANARRNQNKLALLMLDLDHFKDVNDTLGHRIGDRLLQAVSERLTSLLRESDTVARMGGDEFMLILPEVDRAEDAAVVAEKILKSFQKEFILDGHKLNITTSVGIAIYPDDSEDRGELVKKVDIAMYHAKQAGRNNFQHYSNWGVT
jgi:diguanylate cyclase (GGDEF)-like protein/PAS domain S-box-containing protein